MLIHVTQFSSSAQLLYNTGTGIGHIYKIFILDLHKSMNTPFFLVNEEPGTYNKTECTNCLGVWWVILISDIIITNTDTSRNINKRDTTHAAETWVIGEITSRVYYTYIHLYKSMNRAFFRLNERSLLCIFYIHVYYSACLLYTWSQDLRAI